MSTENRDDDWYRDRALRTPSETAHWDDLLARLKSGEIHPIAAQREADIGGLGSLEDRPDAAAHDPSKRPDWTITMALVWIMSRDLEAVRENDNHYRQLCLLFVSDYLGDSIFRYTLKRPEPVTAAKLGVLMNIDGHGVEYAQAKAELWSALFENKLVAYGAPASSNSAQTIPAHEWPRLVPREHRDQEYLGYDNDPLGASYHHVYLSRASVTALWPAKNTQVAEPAASEPKPETPFRAVQVALVKAMRESPHMRTMTKDGVRNGIPGAADLSGPQLNAVFKAAAEEANAPKWLEGGPPSGPKRHRARG